MELNPRVTVRETLKAAQGDDSPVILHLRNGMTLTGKVGDVAEHQVVLAELVGREFHDALVLIEDISVLEVRTR